MNTFLGHLYNCWQFNASVAGLNGQPFLIDSPVYEPGRFAGGLRLTVGGPSAAAIGTGGFKAGGVDWTAMFWIRLITLPAGSTVVAGNLNGRWGGWELRLNSVGILTFSIREGASVKWTITDPVPLAVDTHNLIFLGYDHFAGKHFMRVNDTQFNFGFQIVANPGTPANLVLGSVATDSVSALDGVISLLTLWQSRVVAESEMQALWNGGSGVDYPFV